VGETIDLNLIKTAVIDGDGDTARELTSKAIRAGADHSVVLQDALFSAMDIVGQRMQEGEFYLPEVILSAHAMKEAAAILKPLIAKSSAKPKGRVVLGTVKGDLHDIGKNLVVMFLEGAGFQVIDLGTDVSEDEFSKAVREHEPDILGMSALLTTTMLEMKHVLERLAADGLRDRVRVMIGGAPVTESFRQEIGADGYGVDAAGAVALAKGWMGAPR